MPCRLRLLGGFQIDYRDGVIFFAGTLRSLAVYRNAPMKRFNTFLLLLIWMISGLRPSAAERLRFGGAPVELVINEVSNRTVDVELSPANEGDPKPEPARSSVLVPFPSTEKLRVSDLTSERQVSV